MSLQHKIDFAVILTVDHANPNGDPLNGNRPRTDYDGYGEISDVCLKRKIRDRLMDQGANIFVQSDDRKKDDYNDLKTRAVETLGKDTFDTGKTPIAEAAQKACAQWLDVRAFGQLFAFKKGKGKGKKNEEENTDGESGAGVSIPVRGPVSIHSAFSVEPVSVASIQITKSASGESDGAKRSSDTMGMKHRVDKGVYVFYGSMNPQLAERTGFNDDDAATIKTVLPRLFENDASSARPEGSMAVQKVIWWQHNCKAGQYSSAKVHKSLTVMPDGQYTLNAEATKGLVAEEIDGF